MKTDSLTFVDELQLHSYIWELIQRATQFTVAQVEGEWTVSWPTDSFIDLPLDVEEDQYEEEEQGE